MTPPDSSRQFARLTYEAFFARSVMLVGAFVANIMIARALGAGGKGILTILLVWSGLLASFFSSGIHLATVYELGTSPWHARRLLSLVIPYVSSVTTLVVTGIWLVRERIGHPEISLLFLGSLFAAQLTCNLAFSFLVGLRNQSAVNWLQVANGVCYPALVALILFLHGSLEINLVAFCMVVIPGLMGFAGLILSREKAVQQSQEKVTALRLGTYLRYAGKSTLMTIGTLLYAQIIILILSARSSPAEVGVFSVAMIFIDTATVIPSMVAAFVLPRWAGLPVLELSSRAGRVIRLTHPIAFVVAIGSALLAMLLAGPLFGKDFAGVGVLAWIMVPGAWATTGITVITYCSLAQNRHLLPLSLSWVGVFLTAGLAWWCLPRFGCAGAAGAVSLSRLIVLLLAWCSFTRANRGCSPSMWLPGRDDFKAWGQIIRHSLLWVRQRS